MKLEYFIDNMLKSFSVIYDKLDAGEFYNNVTELLLTMSPVSKTGDRSEEMLELTRVTLSDKLRSLGIDQLLIDELVTVASRVNYGQLPETMHAFVGAVGLAGMDGELWSVEGGNRQVVRCLNFKTRAGGFRGNATEIRRGEGSEFVVKIDFVGSEPREKTFDVVVIAAPLTSDQKRHIKLPDDVDQTFPGEYHKTVATIIKGNPIPQQFGFKVGSNHYQEIFSYKIFTSKNIKGGRTVYNDKLLSFSGFRHHFTLQAESCGLRS